MTNVDWTSLARLIKETRAEVKETEVKEVLLKHLTRYNVNRVAIITCNNRKEFAALNVDQIKYFDANDNLEYDTVPEEYHRRFDLVISFYTTNQYFETEKTAKQFINNVSTMLKRGGRFLCLYHNALRINELLYTRPLGVYQNETFKLERQWQQKIEFFGSRYDLSSVDENKKYTGYLMFNNVFTTLAKRHGLQSQAITSDEILEYLVKDKDYDIYHMIDSEKLKNVALFVK
jgi:hypothetical protein